MHCIPECERAQGLGIIVPVSAERADLHHIICLTYVLHVKRVQGEAAGEFILILCNAIGSPVDSKYLSIEPKYVSLTGGSWWM
jgi:hypothetical protein